MFYSDVDEAYSALIVWLDSELGTELERDEVTVDEVTNIENYLIQNVAGAI